jgi:uncharacterized protein YlxW (UPF0749 family)
MSEFDYDINKYMSYRKTSRDEAENGKKTTLLEEYETLKKEVRQLRAENEVMRNIINSYESECKLSDNAKRFVHDIERGLENE